PVAVWGKTASASLPPSSSMAQAARFSLWLSIPITKVDTSGTGSRKSERGAANGQGDPAPIQPRRPAWDPLSQTLNGRATAGGWALFFGVTSPTPLRHGHRKEPEPVGRTGRYRSSTPFGC